MDLKKLRETLHTYERKVLPALQKVHSLDLLSTETALAPIEVMRGLQWLENKKALKIISDKKKIINLDKNGEKYAKEGLPERRLLLVLQDDFLLRYLFFVVCIANIITK